MPQPQEPQSGSQPGPPPPDVKREETEPGPDTNATPEEIEEWKDELQADEKRHEGE